MTEVTFNIGNISQHSFEGEAHFLNLPVKQMPINNIQAVTWSRSGLPRKVIASIKEHLGITNDELGFMLKVSQSTLQRALKKKKLDADMSERIWSISQLAVQGEEVFGSYEIFMKWLKSENEALGGIKPFDLLETETGFDEVQNLLNQVDFNIYS